MPGVSPHMVNTTSYGLHNLLSLQGHGISVNNVIHFFVLLEDILHSQRFHLSMMYMAIAATKYYLYEQLIPS